VTSNAVLNYEEHGPTQQVYIICHTDAGDVQYSIQVDIVDMEDEPVFINLPATISIPENILTTTTIATVDCSDEDGDPVTYDIDSQDPGSPTFTNTGPNIFAPVGLDFDADPAKRSFELTISCAGTTSTPTAILTVIVQEEYDEPPVFDSTAYDGNVDEDQPAGTVVTWTDDPIVGCTDADVSVTRDDDALYYTISGTNADHFNCDYLTGLVTTARTLEADGGSAILSYTLTLTATDKGGNTDTADLNIVVNGINDLPVFSPSGYTASVAEETVTVVSIASGDDADAKFTITGTTSPYTIETTTFPTDYEDATLIANNHLYTLLVTADDGGGILTTATVVIEITSENEDTPAFTTFPAVVLTMLENSPSGTTVADVGDIVAEDSDEGSDGIISYSIDAVDPNVNKFYIEPSTGEIVTIGTFDYETDPQRYTITVMAADDGNPSNTVTDDIILDIEDYNDNEPIFSQNIYYRDDVVEGSPVDTSVLALTTTDADSIALTTIQYEFVSGNDDDLFKIDQPTETIQIKNIIDLDAGSDDPASYILVIRAVDGGTPELSGTTTVNIVMEAVNDHDPVFGATSPITLTVSRTRQMIVTLLTLN
ncbi:protocadherin-like wing polarity protein stan, partial [Saccoglossus kowalevskii]